MFNILCLPFALILEGNFWSFWWKNIIYVLLIRLRWIMWWNICQLRDIGILLDCWYQKEDNVLYELYFWGVKSEKLIWELGIWREITTIPSRRESGKSKICQKVTNKSFLLFYAPFSFPKVFYWYFQKFHTFCEFCWKIEINSHILSFVMLKGKRGSVSCGYQHSICLSGAGKIFSFGDNRDQLGRETKTKEENQFPHPNLPQID